MSKFSALFVFSFMFSVTSFAGYKGEISFSSHEIQFHKKNARKMSRVARRCLKKYESDHKTFHKENCFRSNGRRFCVSKYYGDRRYTMEKGGKRADGMELEYLPEALEALGVPASFASKMEQISCVGLALECLERGFIETRQEAQWEKISEFVQANGVGGTALQFALAEIGWSTFYWNPAPYWDIENQMKLWDAEEEGWTSKGHHGYRFNRVMNVGKYWFNTVDNAYDLVGFGEGIPEILRDYPFWVGTANTGYHVFPGTRTKVVEAHSSRHFTSSKNLEFSSFSPFRQNGGPRWSNTEKYRSGLIVFPPLGR